MPSSDLEKALRSTETPATILPKSTELDGQPDVLDKKYQITDQTNYLPAKQVVGVFVGLSLALLCSFMEQTILAFTPLYGRWSDIFGRKAVLLFSLVTFWIFSLACALARTMIQLIIFRALQGVGGGALMTLVLIIVADVTTLRERGKFQAINEIMIAFASGIGPILGGVFSTRWCFWINLPLGGLAIVTSILLIPFKPIPGGIKDKLIKIDYAGSGLAILSSALLVLGLSWGGVTYKWESAPVLIPLVLGAVILGGFVIWEWRFAKLPIVPVHIFANPTVLGVYIAALMNVLWLMQSRPNHHKDWQIQRLLSTVDQHSSNGEIIGFLFMGAVGAGGTFQTTVVAAQAAVPRSEMAVVTGVRNFLRIWGSAIALAVCAALVNNSLRSGLTILGFGESQISKILDDPTIINDAASGFTDSQRQMIIDSYTAGFRRIFYMTSACVVLAFFASLFLIKQHELERADDSEIKNNVKETSRIKKEEKRSKM
ncbi:MFS general substrate transporter [Flagelloscypha sp. PMI_526]|nr:MFS general substrate transporter [Flagelloscypha sp. PMI_526]